jgi:hypothetical protein
MYAKVPAHHARAWALCRASSLPPAQLLIRDDMSTLLGWSGLGAARAVALEWRGLPLARTARGGSGAKRGRGGGCPCLCWRFPPAAAATAGQPLGGVRMRPGRRCYAGMVKGCPLALRSGVSDGVIGSRGGRRIASTPSRPASPWG